jgi:hypothetical protein
MEIEPPYYPATLGGVAPIRPRRRARWAEAARPGADDARTGKARQYRRPTRARSRRTQGKADAPARPSLMCVKKTLQMPLQDRFP